MAENDMLKRYLDAGVAFTQMTRARAQAIVKDLVKAGEIQRDQTQEWVDELVERSRKNTEALVDQVRKEVADQLSGLGLATKADLDALERRLTARQGEGAAAPAKKAGGTTTAKKTPAKTATKKTAAKKAPAAKKA